MTNSDAEVDFSSENKAPSRGSGQLSGASVHIFVKRAMIVSLTLLAIALAASFAFSSIKTTLSLLAGSIVSSASFLALVIVVVHAMMGRHSIWLVLLGFVKMCLIGTLLWWLVSSRLVEPLSFLAGFSTLVVALLFEGLRRR